MPRTLGKKSNTVLAIDDLLRQKDPMRSGSIGQGMKQEHAGQSSFWDPPFLVQGAPPEPAAPPEYRPEFFQPEKRTYGFAAAPVPDDLPAPFKRDLERDSRRTLEATGIGGLLGLLFGGGRGAALGAIGASRGFSAGRDRLAQEQQRQQGDLVEQIQQQNARNRQIWADRQADEERKMRQDALEDDRQRELHQGREEQRFWDYQRQRERDAEARAQTERERIEAVQSAESDRLERVQQAQESRQRRAAALEFGGRIFNIKQEFPQVDHGLRELGELLEKGKPRYATKRGRRVIVYTPLTLEEKRAVNAKLMELRKRKNQLIKSGELLRMQQADNLTPIPPGIA